MVEIVDGQKYFLKNSATQQIILAKLKQFRWNYS